MMPDLTFERVYNPPTPSDEELKEHKRLLKEHVEMMLRNNYMGSATLSYFNRAITPYWKCKFKQ